MPKPDYATWIARHRAEAIRRGGKPLRRIPGAGRETNLPLFPGRKRGEMINPETGEIVSGCLTVSKLAAKFGITSAALTDHMERMGMVVRVLAYKSISSPRYYHTPAVTPEAISNGLALPVAFQRSEVDCILITPQGQEALRTAVVGRKPSLPRKIDYRRQEVQRLLLEGHSQAQIAKLTAIPKQTVSRIAKALGSTG